MTIQITNIEDWDGTGPAASLPYDRAVQFKKLCDNAPNRITRMEKWLAEDLQLHGLDESDELDH